MAVRTVVDSQPAEEITQEVFVSLWEHPERIDSGRGTWRPRLGRHDRPAAGGEPTDGQRQEPEHAFFEGPTHFQIAERLDVALGTVTTRIRDGLIKLRGLIGAPA